MVVLTDTDFNLSLQPRGVGKVSYWRDGMNRNEKLFLEQSWGEGRGYRNFNLIYMYDEIFYSNRYSYFQRKKYIGDWTLMSIKLFLIYFTYSTGI